MYITINKKNIVFWGSILCVLLSYKFMYIFFYKSYGAQMSQISWLLALGLSMFLYKEIIALSKKYVFLTGYLIYILLVQIVICIFSIIQYGESVFDMFITAGSYLLLLFSLVLIVGMEVYGTERFLKMFYILAVTYMVLRLIDAVVSNFFGTALLGGYLGSKTAYVRAYAGSLYVVVMIYSFWKIVITETTKRDIIVFVLGLILEIYVQQTRMYQLSLFMTFLFIWIFQRKKASKKLFQYAVLIIFAGVFFGLGLHHEIINSFSADPTVNDAANSSIARLNSIAYFSGFFLENPLFGMGWVRPAGDYLTSIAYGPTHTAYFDDLGFLGQVFRLGILGAMFYVFLIIRLVYIHFKLPKTSEYKNLILGILVFIVISAGTLNCFDGQRILGTAFFIAIVERIFITNKNVGAKN